LKKKINILKYPAAPRGAAALGLGIVDLGY